MKRKLRRSCSILLAILMVVGLFTAIPITASAADTASGSVAGHSLTLNGDIGLNYFISVSDADRNAVKSGTKELNVAFEWETTPAPVTDLSVYNVTVDKDNYTAYYRNGYFKVGCNVAVAEMSCKVKATVTLGENTAEEIFSVRSYAEQVLDPTSSYSNDAVLVDLVKKLLDYGTKAQTVFGINTSEPANADIDYTMEEASAEDIENAVADDSANEGKERSDMTANNAEFGLKYQYSTLVLLSQTSLRHYYLVEVESLVLKNYVF